MAKNKNFNTVDEQINNNLARLKKIQQEASRKAKRLKEQNTKLLAKSALEYKKQALECKKQSDEYLKKLNLLSDLFEDANFASMPLSDFSEVWKTWKKNYSDLDDENKRLKRTKINLENQVKNLKNKH